MMSPDNSRHARRTKARNGLARALAEFIRAYKAALSAALVAATLTTAGVVFKPLRDALVAPVLHSLLPDDVEIKLHPDRRELAVGDRMALHVTLRQKSRLSVETGILSVQSTKGILQAPARSRVALNSGITGLLQVPEAEPFIFEARDTGTTVITAHYGTGRNRQGWIDSLRIHVVPRSEFGEPRVSDLTGLWDVDPFGSSRGRIWLRQWKINKLQGRYELESGEKGIISGSRDGSPVTMLLVRDSLNVRWRVRDARLCADGEYLTVRGTADLEYIKGDKWILMPGATPKQFHAFARVNARELRDAHDCSPGSDRGIPTGAQ